MDPQIRIQIKMIRNWALITGHDPHSPDQRDARHLHPQRLRTVLLKISGALPNECHIDVARVRGRRHPAEHGWGRQGAQEGFEEAD